VWKIKAVFRFLQASIKTGTNTTSPLMLSPLLLIQVLVFPYVPLSGNEICLLDWNVIGNHDWSKNIEIWFPGIGK